MSALRPRAACRGGHPEQRHPVPELRHLASESAACARLPAPESAACPAAAVLQQAAAGSAWDVRALPPAASRASRVQPRAAPAVRVSVPASQQGARVRARPKAAALPALRQAALALRALRPAAGPGARRAVQAVREPGAASDAVLLPGVASALRGQLRAARAEQALQVGSASRVLRPAAEPDVQAARLPEAVLADAARRPAVLALASAFRQVRALPFAAPVRRPAAKFGRATLKWRIASPSAQSWQAARDEALS
ncbi:hypothetical protein FBZ93_10421 [Bradyrhizobium macuxiense]|uniref:Uncharacterized protein n=1 Tax=Bradyrhizobium macuxiense TaxID=1755647 RepID=A0A560M504_9BRAD|nr:hypothetical protein FBZ93_10421 [Bradyrhizobium macuxiense]